MTAIENDNPALRGVLPKDFGRDAVDKEQLGDVVNLVSNINVGTEEARSTDVLGRVYLETRIPSRCWMDGIGTRSRISWASS